VVRSVIDIAILLVNPAALSRPGSRILACGAGATTMQVKCARVAGAGRPLRRRDGHPRRARLRHASCENPDFPENQPDHLAMENRGTWALRTLSAVACAVIALAAGQAGAQGVAVRIAAQEALAPKWLRADGRMLGLCPDIMAAVERLEPRLRFGGFDASRSLPGLEAGLENGSLDAACALIPSERRRVIAQPVGQPVYVTRHRLVVRSSDPVTVEKVADLARLGDLVVSQRGSPFTTRLRAAGVRVDDATDDNEVNMRKMVARHGRFAYVNELTLRHIIRTAGLTGQVRVLPTDLGGEPAYFWVSRKADPAIAPLLGAALDKLKANGELERIHTRWAANP
jgi:polar amino acid transport system substrate-binding protein